jgi:predicted nicotinamide N-methyase
MALELGCGLGLAGIVALSAGLRVTFSDFDPPALLFAAHNALLNGFRAFETAHLDWHNPPEDLQVQVLLGSDLVYEMEQVEPLVHCITKLLAPGGLCLLAGQDRLPSRALLRAVEGSGLPFTSEIVRWAEPGQRQVKGTLYRIWRP